MCSSDLGLRKGKFLFSLYKNDLKTMSEVLYKATKYMTVEDALSAREDTPRKRERPEDARQNHGRKKPRTGDGREDKRSKPPGGRFTRFTPLNAPLDQVLMQIKDEGSDVPRETKERSSQAIQKQILPFPRS